MARANNWDRINRRRGGSKRTQTNVFGEVIPKRVIGGITQKRYPGGGR